MARLVDVEARQREANAAVALLEEGDLGVPQPIRVGPAVDYGNGLFPSPSTKTLMPSIYSMELMAVPRAARDSGR